MDFLYNFILNNQLLLLVIAVLLAMALIGYVAEEYGFYKNKENNLENLEPNDDNQLQIEVTDDISNDNDVQDDNLQEEKSEPIIIEDEELESNETSKDSKESKIKLEQENLNIDKDFSKLLDDDEDIIVGETSETKIDDIDDDLWKF